MHAPKLSQNINITEEADWMKKSACLVTIPNIIICTMVNINICTVVHTLTQYIRKSTLGQSGHLKIERNFQYYTDLKYMEYSPCTCGRVKESDIYFWRYKYMCEWFS